LRAGWRKYKDKTYGSVQSQGWSEKDVTITILKVEEWAAKGLAGGIAIVLVMLGLVAQ